MIEDAQTADANDHGGFRCPKCDGKTRVRLSIPLGKYTISRLRLCKLCGQEFHTRERLTDIDEKKQIQHLVREELTIIINEKSAK